MKKLGKILAPVLGLGLLAGSLVAINVKGAKVEKAEATDPETYIPVNKTDFFQEGWNDAWGYVRTNVNETYWNEGYSYQAMDAFFDGCGWGAEADIREGWKGTLNSRKWTQTTRYIYYTYGCAKDFDIDRENNPVKLVLHCDNEAQEEQDRVTKTYEVWNNTFCGIAMVFRYFEMSTEDFTALGGSFKMWIEFIDQRGNSYGANVFGWLHVNQTWAEVQEAGSRYYNAIRYPNQSGETKIKQQFVNNADLNKITISDLNESFDDQEDFARNFTYDSEYGNNADSGARHADRAISTASVRGGDNDSKMPYNKTGIGLFRGWYDEDVGGYVASDTPTYRFVSREFVLKGTGLISVKMAGNGASLHVINVTKGTETKYNNTCFSTAGGEWDISEGFNTVTMVRHFINLAPFVGDTLKVAIADDAESNWAAVYFDELITRYDSYDDVAFKIDSVVQANKDRTRYVHYFDKFLTNIENDSTPAKEAHDFLTTYYSTCRSVSNHYSRCSASVSGLITTYTTGLSANAKKIVDASEDFDGTNRVGEQAWYDYEIKKADEGGAYTVGRAMEDFIAKQNNGGSQQLAFRLGTNDGNIGTTIIVIVSAIVALGAAGFFFLRRKQEK